jgi:hypothetical protein
VGLTGAVDIMEYRKASCRYRDFKYRNRTVSSGIREAVKVACLTLAYETGIHEFRIRGSVLIYCALSAERKSSCRLWALSFVHFNSL